MNQKHLHRLIEMMYARNDCPELDAYGTCIFSREMSGTWRLFRFLTRTALEEEWKWDPNNEFASYPVVEVEEFEEFATFLLHEVTHGWCHFFKDDPDRLVYSGGIDEEQVCWDVSKLVCKHLGITYRETSAHQSHQFHLLFQKGDLDGIAKLAKEMPTHHQLAGMF